MALALLRGSRRPAGDAALRDRTGERSPRDYLFDEQFSRIYDESILEQLPVHRAMRSVLPPWMQLALEVHRRRDEYDAIMTWSQRTTLALTMLQTFSSNPKPPRRDDVLAQGGRIRACTLVA